MPIYLLAIRGTLAPETLEAARKIHNETAGAPANVAAARSLGDLSHMVYTPASESSLGTEEFLILDLWNNAEGLNQFFSNEQVQEQAGLIFTERDPVVWAPAEGFGGYHLPAPHGKNDRIVALVRGTVKSRESARSIHNSLTDGLLNKARLAGALAHDAYFRMAPPDAPESLEFFSVDVWMDGAGMGQFYQDPEFGSGFQELFEGAPTTSVWTHPAGEWVEW
jgi:hypothetical protein